MLMHTRADNGDRTCDLLITNELLYQLSYIGYWSILPSHLSERGNLRGKFN